MTKLNFRSIAGYVLVFIFSGVANAGGIGGGAILTVIFTFVFK